MTDNTTSYNKIADEWAASRDTAPLTQLVIDFADKVKAGGHILDVGCGTGFPIASYLSSRGFKITGIDVTKNLLVKAMDRGIPNADFHLVDFWNFIPPVQYDGIIAFDSFFHFRKERQRDIYPRLAPWLLPGGYLLFTHGNKEGEIEGEMFDELFYYSCLDTREVHELLEQNGFDIEWTKEYYTEYDMDRDLVISARKR